ncbi:MAG: peptide-methionine (R)-S-oxide reductase MsrB [Alphaproteobacteria bacterium]|nr:peptide-methionine (R)-S-oxide reductase MsrB [Alphaproteobacteria bacterium]
MAKDKGDKIVKSKEEWRAQLTPDQYYVTREHGTEPAYSGVYDQCKDKGIYNCVCCDNPLFRSSQKFDSGTGWPSFYDSITKNAVADKKDRSFFMVRTEIVCAKCDAHLGHVFPDGPPPTGLRYCMNSLSLDLQKTEEPGETD